MGKSRHMQFTITGLLKQNRLHVTPCRKMILELFFNSPVALSHHDIETRYSHRYDRITIYRTLQAFVEKGILQVVPTLSNCALYILKADATAVGEYQQYTYFLCKHCRKITLVGVERPGPLPLPPQFTPQEISTIVEGKCHSCDK